MWYEACLTTLTLSPTTIGEEECGGQVTRGVARLIALTLSPTTLGDTRGDVWVGCGAVISLRVRPTVLVNRREMSRSAAFLLVTNS